jgi:ABC-type branched-subunit amino acid transport system substrate-binding protein/TolA-binding protein
MRFCLCAVIALGLLAGCAAGGAGKKGERGEARALPRTPEMERSFQNAERLLFARKFDQAREAYEAYLENFPRNALTAKAYFRLGEILFHQEDFEKALSFYKKSSERGIDPDWGGVAVYKQAVCHSKMGNDKKVLSVLDRVPWDPIDAKVAIRAASLRVTTARKAEEPLEEKKGYLELIDAYETVRPQETKVGELSWIVSEKKARDEIRQWIAAEDPDEEKNLGTYKKWMKRFEGKSSGGYLAWKIARLYHQKGDYGNAAGWIRDYLQSYPKHEYRVAARSLLTEIEKRGVAAVPEGGRSAVGILLPLSGRLAVYGESVLHGLECAAGIFVPCRGDLGLNLLIRDTEGDPRTAAKIVNEFAQNPEVKAVIGPLPQVEVDAAAAASEEGGLPMITLSQKPGVAKTGEYIFRNFLTVTDQVATLVDYACRDKRWKRHAILYPEGGEEYRRAFEEEVSRCGGKVIAKASYPAGTRNFTEAVRTLKFASSEQSAEAPIPFETLFVPDVYRRIPDLIAAMKFLGMTGVHLLGGAGWDHPDLVKGGGADVEGAIFVDGFFARANNFATRDFVSTFQSAYGFEPTLLEAYAYDTLRLVGEVLRDHPTAERSEIQKVLARKRNFPGVTGSVSFDEEGDARRKLFILTVEQGEIKEVP